MCAHHRQKRDPAREINTISTSHFPFIVTLQDSGVPASKAVSNMTLKQFPFYIPKKDHVIEN